MTSDEIGYRAAAARADPARTVAGRGSLEEAFMSLTHDAVEYRAPARPRIALTAGARIDTTGPRGRSASRLAADLSSEWIKLRTLRSSWSRSWSPAVAVGMADRTHRRPTRPATSNWANARQRGHHRVGPAQGVELAQLFVGVLGALFVTGEYGTGMIRSTFAAVPRRLPVLIAKSVVYGGDRPGR